MIEAPKTSDTKLTQIEPRTTKPQGAAGYDGPPAPWLPGRNDSPEPFADTFVVSVDVSGPLFRIAANRGSVHSQSVSDVTRLLEAAQQGDPKAADQLLPIVYDELRKLAAARMNNEAAGHTLQPTALVHEAWLRLTHNEPNSQFANRAHFFAAAAEAMRRILINHALAKAAGKRGGGWKRLDLNKVELAADADDDTLLLVNESLEQLAKEKPTAAEIVKLRFFAGLTLQEAGQVLGFTERTAKRHWTYARAWLYHAMKKARES